MGQSGSLPSSANATVGDFAFSPTNDHVKPIEIQNLALRKHPRPIRTQSLKPRVRTPPPNRRFDINSFSTLENAVIEDKCSSNGWEERSAALTDKIRQLQSEQQQLSKEMEQLRQMHKTAMEEALEMRSQKETVSQLFKAYRLNKEAELQRLKRQRLRLEKQLATASNVQRQGFYSRCLSEEEHNATNVDMQSVPTSPGPESAHLEFICNSSECSDKASINSASLINTSLQSTPHPSSFEPAGFRNVGLQSCASVTLCLLGNLLADNELVTQFRKTYALKLASVLDLQQRLLTVEQGYPVLEPDQALILVCFATSDCFFNLQTEIQQGFIDNENAVLGVFCFSKGNNQEFDNSKDPVSKNPVWEKVQRSAASRIVQLKKNVVESLEMVYLEIEQFLKIELEHPFPESILNLSSQHLHEPTLRKFEEIELIINSTQPNLFENATQLSLLSNRLQLYNTVPDLFADDLVYFQDYLKNQENNLPLLFTGDSGTGVSVLAAAWVARLQKRFSNTLVLFHFVEEQRAHTRNVLVMAHRWFQNYFPTTLLPKQQQSYSSILLLKSALERFHSLSTDQIVVVIDRLDMIQNDDEELSWLLTSLLPFRCKVFIGVEKPYSNAIASFCSQWPVREIRLISCTSLKLPFGSAPAECLLTYLSCLEQVSELCGLIKNLCSPLQLYIDLLSYITENYKLWHSLIAKIVLILSNCCEGVSVNELEMLVNSEDRMLKHCLLLFKQLHLISVIQGLVQLNSAKIWAAYCVATSSTSGPHNLFEVDRIFKLYLIDTEHHQLIYSIWWRLVWELASSDMTKDELCTLLFDCPQFALNLAARGQFSVYLWLCNDRLDMSRSAVMQTLFNRLNALKSAESPPDLLALYYIQLGSIIYHMQIGELISTNLQCVENALEECQLHPQPQLSQPLLALAFKLMSQLHLQQGKLNQAHLELSRAINLYQTIFGIKDIRVVLLLEELLRICKYDHRIEEVEKLETQLSQLRLDLNLTSSATNLSPSSDSCAHKNFATFSGCDEKQEENFNAASVPLSQLATLYLHLGKPQQALELLEHTKNPKSDVKADELDMIMADAYRRQNNWVNAEYYYRLVYDRQLPGSSSAAVYGRRVVLCLLQLGESERAKELLAELCRLCDTHQMMDAAQKIKCYWQLAVLHCRDGQHDLAEPLFCQAVTLLEEFPCNDYQLKRQLLTNYAKFLLDIGNELEATKYYKMAMSDSNSYKQRLWCSSSSFDTLSISYYSLFGSNDNCSSVRKRHASASALGL